MHPLISCVCVTRNRPHLIGTAISSFLAQDWPNKELVVVDDGESEIRDLLCEVPEHRYISMGGGQQYKIGTKRNVGSDAARGEFIASWDDDDWSAPTRLSDQAERIIRSGRGVTGYHSMLFWDEDQGSGFKYCHGADDYALGTSLFYRKAFWQRHPFIAESPRMYEDNQFVQQARTARDITSADAGKLMVARIHSQNVCPKKPLLNPRQWTPVSAFDFPPEFFAAIAKEVPVAL